MNEYAYCENDSKNAFKGIVFACLSVFFGLVIPIFQLNMDVGNELLYYKISMALSIVLIIPFLYYRGAVLKVSGLLCKKTQRSYLKEMSC